jgi:Flp pilus assembly protein TadD
MNRILLLLIIPCLFFIGCASGPAEAPDTKLADDAFDLILKGDYEQAEATLEVAQSINPDNPLVLLNLGVVYQNTGRVEKAREMYVRIILLNPPDVVGDSNVTGAQGKKVVDLAKQNLENL